MAAAEGTSCALDIKVAAVMPAFTEELAFIGVFPTTAAGAGYNKCPPCGIEWDMAGCKMHSGQSAQLTPASSPHPLDTAIYRPPQALMVANRAQSRPGTFESIYRLIYS